MSGVVTSIVRATARGSGMEGWMGGVRSGKGGGEVRRGTRSWRPSDVRKAQALFIAALARSANVSASARAAGVERGTLYHWRESDRSFAEAWSGALEEATDHLEAEARRRAIEGYDEPVLRGGTQVLGEDGQPLSRRRYSDGLMTFLLRAHRPAKFKAVDEERTGAIMINISADDAVL